MITFEGDVWDDISDSGNISDSGHVGNNLSDCTDIMLHKVSLQKRMWKIMLFKVLPQEKE